MISERKSHTVRYDIIDDFNLCMYPLLKVHPTPQGAKALPLDHYDILNHVQEELVEQSVVRHSNEEGLGVLLFFLLDALTHFPS